MSSISYIYQRRQLFSPVQIKLIEPVGLEFTNPLSIFTLPHSISGSLRPFQLNHVCSINILQIQTPFKLKYLSTQTYFSSIKHLVVLIYWLFPTIIQYFRKCVYILVPILGASNYLTIWTEKGTIVNNYKEWSINTNKRGNLLISIPKNKIKKITLVQLTKCNWYGLCWILQNAYTGEVCTEFENRSFI